MPEIVDRAQQIKEIVGQNPGITSKEVAEEIGLTPGRVCQLVGTMREAGDIKQKPKGHRKGSGLHLTDAAVRRRYITRRWK